jgi:protein SMG6
MTRWKGGYSFEARILNSRKKNGNDVLLTVRSAYPLAVLFKSFNLIYRLADIISELLTISLAPSIPASLRQIPTKYNIIVHLWTFAFHRLLESLRRASFLITGGVGASAGQTLTLKAILDAGINASIDCLELTDSLLPPTSAVAAALVADSSDVDAAKERIDNSPSPSVGIVAARSFEVEPEKELWRTIARDWYAAGLAEQPGTAKLHHHLGLLSRGAEGEELKGIYHFIKRSVYAFLSSPMLTSFLFSMTALHPFPTARKSVLPLWSSPAQAHRFLADAQVSNLFVLLHGMLFTNIQLDLHEGSKDIHDEARFTELPHPSITIFSVEFS